MSLRSTVLGALLLAAGCAASVPSKPPPKPRQAHAAPPAPAEPTPGSDATGEATADDAPAQAPPSEAAPAAPGTHGPAPDEPAASKPDPFGDVGFNEINEKQWLARIRENIAQREKIAP